jgi:hypothetical protein
MINIHMPIDDESTLLQDMSPMDDDEAIEEALANTEQTEAEVQQMVVELDELKKDIDENLPQITAALRARWGFISSAWNKAKEIAAAAKRKAEAAARAVAAKALAALNWAKNKAASLVNQFKGYIRKVDLLKAAKAGVDAFFKLTANPVFERGFKLAVTPIARAFGFTSADVNAAYKLMTKAFWVNQIWFFKWIFTGGFVASAKSASGPADFKRAAAACKDFVGTVGLGGKIMTKLKTMPQVMAAGVTIVAGAKIAKPVCMVFTLAANWRKVYDGAKYALNKVGIHLHL